MSRTGTIVYSDAEVAFDVSEFRGKWWLDLKIKGQAANSDTTIAIMPSTADLGLAVDAALEFSDRIREGRVRPDMTSADVMAECVRNARRQR